jgi:hypothetical protein
MPGVGWLALPMATGRSESMDEHPANPAAASSIKANFIVVLSLSHHTPDRVKCKRPRPGRGEFLFTREAYL